MKNKVLPFTPVITDKQGAEQAAMQLEEIINKQAEDGWRFVSLESMTTAVKATGCNALSSQNIKGLSIQLIVFQK